MSLYEDLKIDSSMEVWLDFQDNRDDKYILGYNGGKKGTLHSGVSSDFSTADGPTSWLPRAFGFDATSTLVEVDTVQNLQNTDEWSFSAWMKADESIDSTFNNRIFIVWGGSAAVRQCYIAPYQEKRTPSYIYQRQSQNGTLLNIATTTPQIAFADEQRWVHHCWVKRSGSGIETYENGISRGSFGSDITSWNGTQTHFALGGYSATYAGPSYLTHAKVAGFTCFSRALTDAEVNALYAGPSVRKLGGEKLWLCPSIADPHSGDEGAVDLSGEGNNGTLEGSMTTTSYSEREGTTAFEFDGSSQYVELDETESSLQPANITVACWAKGNGTNSDGYLIAMDDGSLNDYSITVKDSGSQRRVHIALETTSGYLGYYWNHPDGVIGNDIFEKWNHYALSYDGTTARLYFNGEEVYSTTSGIGGDLTYPAPIGLRVGSDSSSSPSQDFDGMIDDVRIFDRALSASEVAKLASTPAYQDPVKTLGGKVLHLCPSLMEGGGDVQPDLSYNGNKGTLNGATIIDDTENGGTRAYSFDGTGDSVDFDPPFTSIGSGDYVTYAGWMKVNSTGSSQVLMSVCDNNGSTSEQRKIGIEINSSGNPVAVVQDSADSAVATGSSTVTAGEWFHIAGVFYYSGSQYTAEVYLNGVSEDSTSLTSITMHTLTAGFLGKTERDNGNAVGELNGYVDDARIYYRELSATEIARLASKRGYQQPKKGVGKEMAWLCPTKDDRDGTYDISYNGINGTLSGATVITETNAGGSRAFSLDGTDDQVTFSLDTALSTNASIALWIKVPDDHTQLTCPLRDNSLAGGWFMAEDYLGNMRARVAGTSFTITKDYADYEGQWTHHVMTKEGGAVKYYIDGDEVYSNTGFANTASQTLWRLGKNGQNSQYAECESDDIRFFDYELSPNQIAMLYNNGQGRGYELPLIGDEVLAYLPSLDTANNGSTSEITDLSGHGRHGTLSGSMTAGDWAANTDKGGMTAIDLDGSNDQIVVPVEMQQASYYKGNQATWSMWFNPDSNVANGVLFGGWNASGDRIVLIRTTSGGGVDFFTFTDAQVGSTIIGSSSLSASNWYHLLFQYDGEVMSAYLDGVKQATTFSQSGELGEGPIEYGLRIGNDLTASGTFQDGSVSDIRVFDRVLTNAEIKHLASQRAPLSRPALSSDYVPPIFWYCPTLDLSRIQTDVTGDLSDEGVNGLLTNMDAATDWPQDTNAGGYWANDFDGTDDKVEGDAPVGVGLSALTVSCWINTSMAAGGGIVASAEAASDRSWLVYKTSGDVIAFYATSASNSWDSDIIGTTTIHDGNWHHIVAVYDGTNDLKLYIDNASEGSITGTEPATLRTGTGDISIGDWDSTEFDGLIDDVRIFDQALTADQISDLYNDGEGRGILTPAAAAPSTFAAYLAYRATTVSGVLR